MNMDHQSRILIVDDEPIGRRLIEMLLADQGYILTTASNGIEALVKAAETPPDLILLDIMMPHMDGFEVCERIRNNPILSDVPVVMITALDDRASRLRGIEVGADDFISKPIDRMEVQKRIQTIIRLDRYRRLHHEREQRQQVEEEIRRRNRELMLLNRVIMVAASTFDVQAVLHVACEALTEALEMSQAIVFLLDDTRTAVTFLYNYHTPAHPIDASHTVIQQAVNGVNQTQQNALTHFLSDSDISDSDLSTLVECHPVPITAIPAFQEIAHTKQLLVIREPILCHQLNHTFQLSLNALADFLLVLVPIFTRDRVDGLILLQGAEHCPFGDHDLELAQSIATTTGQSLETATLYQELQRHASQLEETVNQRTIELRSERDRTQAILEAVGEAVIVTDRDGIVLFMNPAATTLTGYTAEAVLGQNWYLLQGDPHALADTHKIQTYIQSGQLWRGEVPGKRCDGQYYDAALTVAPLFDPHEPETIIGMVSVRRDITPLKEAERLKDEFVSNVSHELRTPLSILTLLSGNLDTLYSRLDNEKRRAMVRDIREHTHILNDLINSVLAISRIDSGHISTDYHVLDLAQILAAEVQHQCPLAHRKEQTLTLKSCGALRTFGDDNQMRHVIRNVLNNAIKYTPEQGHILCECARFMVSPTTPPSAAPTSSPITWEILNPEEPTVWPGRAALPPGDWAALRISDNGIGIAAADLPYIFNRFYRVQSQGNIPGTGLGLSIVSKLIELIGGHLSIASTPNVGSVVAIYLPWIEETQK